MPLPPELTEYDDEPQTRSSSRRSGGPPRKYTGAAVLDPNEDLSAPARPPSTRFTAFLIVAVLAIMVLTVLFLNR
jgi:hypothetical protein